MYGLVYLLTCTLPETNSSPLKMDAWKTILSYWVSANFQGRAVSFREYTSIKNPTMDSGHRFSYTFQPINPVVEEILREFQGAVGFPTHEQPRAKRAVSKNETQQPWKT